MSWTDLTTNWYLGEKHIVDTITVDRMRVYLDDTQISNPWGGPKIEEHSTEEMVKIKLEIDWCDSAGTYTGSLTLDAHQN